MITKSTTAKAAAAAAASTSYLHWAGWLAAEKEEEVDKRTILVRKARSLSQPASQPGLPAPKSPDMDLETFIDWHQILLSL